MSRKSFSDRFAGLFGPARAAQEQMVKTEPHRAAPRAVKSPDRGSHPVIAASKPRVQERTLSGYFDPALGPDPDVRKVPLESLDTDAFPLFVDIIGQRSTVSKWSEVYAVAMTAAQRCLENNASLEVASGTSVWPGRKYDGYLYLPDIDASVKRPNNAQMITSIKTIARKLHLPVTLRCQKGGSEIVFKANPRRDLIPVPGSLVPYRLASKPRVSLQKDDRNVSSNPLVVSNPFDVGIDARDQIILVGSKVTIAIEGISAKSTFMITSNKTSTAPNELNANTSIGQAIMGHQPGDLTSYEVMGTVRKIRIQRVDNSGILYHMGFDPKIDTRQTLDEMSF